MTCFGAGRGTEVREARATAAHCRRWRTGGACSASNTEEGLASPHRLTDSGWSAGCTRARYLYCQRPLLAAGGPGCDVEGRRSGSAYAACQGCMRAGAAAWAAVWEGASYLAGVLFRACAGCCCMSSMLAQPCQPPTLPNRPTRNAGGHFPSRCRAAGPGRSLGQLAGCSAECGSSGSAAGARGGAAACVGGGQVRLLCCGLCWVWCCC